LGTAFHAYNGFLFDNVLQVHNSFPEKILLGTESGRCSIGEDPWNWAERDATDIIGDLNAWAVGWMDWNLLVDASGGPSHGGHCNALLMLDQNGDLSIQIGYYLVGQIYRSAIPGSVRIGHYANSGAMQIVTLLNPLNQVVVIIANTQNTPYTVSLQHKGTSTGMMNVLEHSIVTLTYTNW